MKIIPTHIHAIMDYLLGVLLILLPWILGFAGGAETWILVIAGLGLIAYSAFTDYEYAVARKIPVSTHLTLDICSGVLLLILPWVLNFTETATWTYVIVGLLEIGAGLMTRSIPESERTPPVHAARAR